MLAYDVYFIRSSLPFTITILIHCNNEKDSGGGVEGYAHVRNFLFAFMNSANKATYNLLNNKCTLDLLTFTSILAILWISI